MNNTDNTIIDLEEFNRYLKNMLSWNIEQLENFFSDPIQLTPQIYTTVGFIRVYSILQRKAFLCKSILYENSRIDITDKYPDCIFFRAISSIDVAFTIDLYKVIKRLQIEATDTETGCNILCSATNNNIKSLLFNNISTTITCFISISRFTKSATISCTLIYTDDHFRKFNFIIDNSKYVNPNNYNIDAYHTIS